MARDCRGRGDPNLAQNKQTQFDSEYSALMAELGEGGGGGGAAGGRPAGAVDAGPAGGPAPPPEQRIPPWRLPENWMPSKYFKQSWLYGILTNIIGQRPGAPMAPPHAGFQQPYTQNAGYGYGGYHSGIGMPGAADPYAAWVEDYLYFVQADDDADITPQWANKHPQLPNCFLTPTSLV